MSEDSMRTDVIERAVELACRAPSLHNSIVFNTCRDWDTTSRSACLSGGIDSSVVVALLAEQGQHGLATFSIGWCLEVERLVVP